MTNESTRATLKATRGPWVIDTDDFVHILNGPSGQHLAEIERNASCTAIFSVEEGQANAHLIAAAPDLYAALELAAYALDSTGMGCNYAKVALAKARGEQSND